MPLANQTPASLLLAVRNGAATHASSLSNDWLPLTWKGAAGGETFTVQFFDIHGGELTPSVAVTTLGTDECAIATLLTDAIAAAAWEDGSEVFNWIGTYGSLVSSIAFLRISDVVGTVYIGAGATSDKPYGEFEGATFSITGPAAGTTHVLSATDYGFSA